MNGSAPDSQISSVERLPLQRMLVYIPALLFFTFIGLRAAFVSFTHDEALTFLNYITHPWDEIINVNYTNNHLLNSLLAKLSYTVFGSSEFALRLPNVLAALLFAVYATKLLRKILPGKTTWIFALIAVCLNAFQIDFFALCRGYGLSLGLMMCSFYFLFRYAENRILIRFAFLSLISMALAVFANYTVLLLFLIHITAIGFLEFKNRFPFSRPAFPVKSKRFLFGILWFLLALFFTYMLIRLMLQIKSYGGENFNFGGTTGFWSDTVSSLGYISCLGEWRLFYPLTGDSFAELMMYWIAIVFGMTSIIFLFRLLRNRTSVVNQFQLYLFSLLFFCGTGIWLMNKWLGIPFSTERTALYLIPVFSLFLCLVLFAEGKAGIFRKAIAFLFFIHPVFSFGLTANLSFVENWKFNEGNREASGIIFREAESAICNSSHTIVAVDYLMYPVYNYYRFRNAKANFEELVSYDCGFRSGADFYFGNEDPGESYKLIWTGTECKVWQYKGCFCDSVLHVWQQTEKPDVQLLPDGTKGNAWVNTEEKNYLAYFTDTIRDTIPAGNWFRLHASVCAERIDGINPLQLRVMRGDQEIVSQVLPVDHLINGMENRNTIERWSYCPVEILPGDIVHTFVFVRNQSRIFVTDFSVSLHSRKDCSRNE